MSSDLPAPNKKPELPSEYVLPQVLPAEEETSPQAIPVITDGLDSSPLVLVLWVFGLIVFLGLAIGFIWWLWPSWDVYVSQEGNFGIMLPARPESFVREAEVPGLPGKTRFFTMEVDHDYFYVAAYADLPKEVETNRKLLEKIRYAQFAGVFTKLTVDPLPTGIIQDFKGFPGLRYRFIVREHGHTVMWVILAKQRLYVLMACAEDIEPNDDIIKRFWDSFDFYDDP